MNENNEVDSYEMLSSQEVVVEFGAEEKELVGSVLTENGVLIGNFGTAELMLSEGDNTVLMDTEKMKLKVVDRVYRSIIIKRNRKKEVKGDCKEGDKVEVEIVEFDSEKEPNMFSSSEEPVQ